MGIFDKVRNMFTEEVDEPETLVKETEQKEEKIEPKDKDIEIQQQEKEIVEKPKPIFFDEQDFEALEKPRHKEEKKISEEKYYAKKTEPAEKKVFKLSPVISPVYGVLDKNYHKEDITPKRSTPKVTYYDKDSISIDEVRKKAYGTLEDDLETSLTSNNQDNEHLTSSRMKRIYNDDVMLEDLMDPDYKDDFTLTDSEYESDNNDKKSQIIEPTALDDLLLNTSSNKETILDDDYKDPLEDTLTENDLFHLIDSMYDKEDE